MNPRARCLARAAVLLLAGLLGLVALGVHARGLNRELDRSLSFAGTSYVGSNECRSCHPSNHDSWRHTFHRTMTQEATPDSVLGDFSDATFDYGGVRARMSRTPDGGFEIALDGARAEDHRRFHIARTVGSRRYQQYLAQDDDVYVRLPLAWSVEEQRWLHLNGAFLTPDPPDLASGAPIARDDYDRHVARWNDNCIYCHNVAPQPGLDPLSGRFDTKVAELGIACEACHGPGAAHVQLNHDPLRRFALHLSGRADPTIANPARLPAQRSAEICGHCHGQRLAPNIAQVHQLGDRFRPGDALADYSQPLFRQTTLNGEPGAFAARFWPDGTARLTAYEYQGLLQSACAQRGALTCISCHSMHAGDPRGQLDPAHPGDALCTGCHSELAGVDQQRAHTHHSPTSEGARCVSCHMPRVVYGIVGAHRSHRIDSPDPAASAESSRPDACTLCHADKTRAWAADAVASWTRESPRAATASAAVTDDGAPPELTRLLLAGDPIERAVAADALGYGEPATRPAAERARRAGLLLDTMREDDYPAVRAIAWRSLRTLLAASTDGRLAPATAFTATDDRAHRLQRAQAIAAHLPPAALAPIAAQLAATRVHRSDTAIFIGE